MIVRHRFSYEVLRCLAPTFANRIPFPVKPNRSTLIKEHIVGARRYEKEIGVHDDKVFSFHELVCQELEIELIPEVIRPKFGEVLPVHQACILWQPNIFPEITIPAACNHNKATPTFPETLVAGQEDAQ